MRLSKLFLAVAVPVVLCAAQDGQQGAKHCYRTEAGAKCGVDRVLSWTMCGDPPQRCNLLEICYDSLRSCVEKSSGFETCDYAPCLKHTITRQCVMPDGEEECRFVSDDTEVELMGTKAAGDLCLP